MFYGSDNFSVGVGLSIASPTHYSSRYMADQTFHTPNFGDEEFDIPPIALPPHGHDDSHIHQQHNMSYSMGMHGVVNQGQQQHYTTMYLPEHMTTPMTMSSPVSYGGSPPTYTNLSSPHPPPQQQSQMVNPGQQQQQQQQHIMHHPHNQQGVRPQHQSVMGTNVPPRRSPSNNSTSPANPETTTSDDSDDSVPHPQGSGVGGGVKRPSPEPDTRTIPTSVTTPKKPKAQKKKKKRDPNEPQKPVSAYALFFRDTQAAIKGQNPNASFGEVSKIVASMWDALDADHKNVYKKKTEAAKKEYLKALAAYRASLVSKGAPTDSPDGSGMFPPPSFSAPPHYPQPPQTYYGNQQQSPQGSQQQKQSPQSKQSQQPMAPPQQQQQQQQQHAPGQQQQQQQPGHPMMQQMTTHMDSNQYGNMSHNAAYMNQMSDGNHGMGVGSGMHMNPQGGHSQMSLGNVINHMGSENQNHPQRQMCVRNGCSNVASNAMEADIQGFDEGYCSSQCVVSHCRDVFTNWVSTNQTANPNYGSGIKFTSGSANNSGCAGLDGLSYADMPRKVNHFVINHFTHSGS